MAPVPPSPIADSALRVDGKGPQRPAAQNCSFGACGSVVWTSSWQAHLELGHPLDRVVHLTHGQAEPVPEKPEPLAAQSRRSVLGRAWCSVVRGGSWQFRSVGRRRSGERHSRVGRVGAERAGRLPRTLPVLVIPAQDFAPAGRGHRCQRQCAHPARGIVRVTASRDALRGPRGHAGADDAAPRRPRAGRPGTGVCSPAGFQIMITESRFDRHDLYNCI